MKIVDWVSVDDGAGIIGWGYDCPSCNFWNMFPPDIGKPVVTCYHCGVEIANPDGDPDFGF